MGASEANAIVPLAYNYARIRAAVAPFSILGFVAQSVSRRMFVILFHVLIASFYACIEGNFPLMIFVLTLLNQYFHSFYYE